MNDTLNDAPMTLLYVADVAASAAFYQRLTGSPPLEASPGFAMFRLGNAGLGLWKRADVQPAAAAAAGAAELCWPVDDRAAVDAQQRRWQALGVPITQAATAMDFGYTFAASDPDGHRLRVFTPEGD